MNKLYAYLLKQVLNNFTNNNEIIQIWIRSIKIVVVFLIFEVLRIMLEFDFVPEKSSDSSKSFHKLSPFRSIRAHKLKLTAIILVITDQPLQQIKLFVIFIDLLQLDASHLIEIWLICLFWFAINCEQLPSFGVFHSES